MDTLFRSKLINSVVDNTSLKKVDMRDSALTRVDSYIEFSKDNALDYMA